MFISLFGYCIRQYTIIQAGMVVVLKSWQITIFLSMTSSTSHHTIKAGCFAHLVIKHIPAIKAI